MDLDDPDTRRRAEAILELSQLVKDRAETPEEAMNILGSVLADVVRRGVVPSLREEWLAAIIRRIREMWARDDAREGKPTTLM